MPKWLQSGVRRDACIVLYDAGELRLKDLKKRVQERYGEQFRPERFRRKVQKLVDAGHLERRTEGLHDVYALTETGRDALEDHVAWVRKETGL